MERETNLERTSNAIFVLWRSLKVMEDYTIIGRKDSGAINSTQGFFGMPIVDRERHLYCVGKTGMGKSTLLHGLITQDIQAGRGVALLDPHGDLAESIHDYVPRSRINDVVYFNPADVDHPIGLNFFSKVSPDQRYLVTEHTVSVFSHIWGLNEENAPRLLNLLRFTIAALLEKQGTTLLGIYRMLVDDDFRKHILANVKDLHTRQYWEEDFDTYDPRERRHIIDSTLNKIGLLQSSPVIRNIIGQVQNRLDLGNITDKKKILICNLSKGKLGEQGSRLLGSLIAINLYLTFMERADTPEEERVPFYFYADEFQNFGNTVFKDILSESRKYKLNLTIAHQYIEQLDHSIIDSVFGNVGSMISFQTSARDGELLAREYSAPGEEINPRIFNDLGRHEIFVRLLQYGESLAPFRGVTSLPPGGFNYRDTIIKHSRNRYARNRQDVESNINEWMLR